MEQIYKFELYLTNGVTKYKYIDSKPKPVIDGEYKGLGIYENGDEISIKIICKDNKLILKRVIKQYIEEGKDSDILDNINVNYKKITLNKYQKNWLSNISIDEINYTKSILGKITNFQEWFPFVFEKNKLFNISNYTALKGKIQSSKSMAIRAASTGCYLYGIPVIVVLKNTTQDAIQLVDGWINLNNDISKKYKKMFGKNFEKIKVVKGDKKSINKDPEIYKNILNSNKPGVIVSLANVHQIGSLLTLINNNFKNTPPFVLIIDEVDKVNHQGNKENKNDTNVYSMLDELSNLAIHTFGVSATMFDVLFEESKLKPNRMFNLPVPSFYRDINQISLGIDFRLINSEEYISKQIKSLKAPKEYSEYEVNDCMVNYYETLSKLPPHKLNIDEFDFHPINVLHVDSKQTINHKHNYNWITKNPKTKNFSAIVYDQVKQVYSPQLINEYPSFALKNNANGHFVCKANTTIREIYSELRKYGATHIVCFSGYLASRGINFVNETYTIQLTNQYYIPSKNETWADLYQGLRMLGVHKYTGSLPMMLYTHEKVWNELIKGYWLQEDIYNNIKNEDFNIDVPAYMEKIVIHKSKKVKRSLGRKKSNTLNIAKEDEKSYGMSENDFKQKLDIVPVIDNEYKKNNPSIELVDTEEDIESDNETDLDVELDDYDNKLFNKISKILYQKKYTNITIFLSMINPEKIYAKNEILSILKNSKYENPIQYFNSLIKKTKYGFGHIFIENKYGWIIKKQLINAWN